MNCVNLSGKTVSLFRRYDVPDIKWVVNTTI